MQSTMQILSRFSAAERWIDEHRKSLVVKYNNQWIAVLNNSVVDHGKNINKMRIRLKEKYDGKYEQVTIDYISKYTADNMILVC